MKTQQTPKPSAFDRNRKRHVTPTRDKIYWRDLPADSQIAEIPTGEYYYDNKLVYWHGHEVQQAMFWLGTHLSDKAISPKPTQPTHSPLPWRIDAETVNHAPIITADDGHGRDLAEIRGNSKDERAADAAYIVRACNNAERLAEALRAMALVGVWGKSSPVLAQAREALAQWEAGK